MESASVTFAGSAIAGLEFTVAALCKVFVVGTGADGLGLAGCAGMFVAASATAMTGGVFTTFWVATGLPTRTNGRALSGGGNALVLTLAILAA